MIQESENRSIGASGKKHPCLGQKSGNRGIGESGKKHLLAICHLPFAICFLLPLLGGCQQAHETVLVGRPEGPYRLELAVSPPQPQAGQETALTYRLTDTKTREAVSDLQILHERIIHTFIVSQDFQTFAHTHHEDFFPLTPQDIAAAQFHFPYTFPQAGTYLIAGEFTHKDRSWVKQFTVNVVGSNEGQPGEVIADLVRTKTFGQYQVSLATSPDPPVVGHDAELVLHLTREGTPVSDLGLHLGTEVGELELAGPVVAPALDHGGGVGVGRMPVDLGDGDAGAAAVAQEGLKGLDVLVAARLAELEPDRAIGIVHPDPDPDVEAGQPLLGGPEELRRAVAPPELGVDEAHADLLEEQQVVVADRADRYAVGQLDIGGVVLVDRRAARLGEPRQGGGQREGEQVASFHASECTAPGGGRVAAGAGKEWA